jgi:hypothetical protein
MLVGRDELISNFKIVVQRAVLGKPGQSLMPVGLRGVGKTVLLNRFAEEAEALGLQVSLIEAPEEFNLREVLAKEARRILLRLDSSGPLSHVVKRGLRIFKSFTITANPDGSVSAGMAGMGLDPEVGVADSGLLTDDVTDLLVALGEAARDRHTGVLLAIDEVQYLGAADLAALITAIHRTTQLQLPLVLVGAGLPQLPALAGNAKSYAERLFTFPQIGPLPEPEARRAIAQPANVQGVLFSRLAVTEIVKRSHGYPYFLQEWAYETWNVATSSPVQSAAVERAADSVLRKLDQNFFRVRFDRLTPAERRYLRAMAELGPGPHRSGDVAARYGARVESAAPMRSALIKKGMIYSPSHGDTAFTVPLFDEFLKRALPFENRPSKGPMVRD